MKWILLFWKCASAGRVKDYFERLKETDHYKSLKESGEGKYLTSWEHLVNSYLLDELGSDMFDKIASHGIHDKHHITVTYGKGRYLVRPQQNEFNRKLSSWKIGHGMFFLMKEQYDECVRESGAVHSPVLCRGDDVVLADVHEFVARNQHFSACEAVLDDVRFAAVNLLQVAEFEGDPTSHIKTWYDYPDEHRGYLGFNIWDYKSLKPFYLPAEFVAEVVRFKYDLIEGDDLYSENLGKVVTNLPVVSVKKEHITNHFQELLNGVNNSKEPIRSQFFLWVYANRIGNENITESNRLRLDMGHTSVAVYYRDQIFKGLVYYILFKELQATVGEYLHDGDIHAFFAKCVFFFFMNLTVHLYFNLMTRFMQ